MPPVERLAAGGDVAALVRSPLLWAGLAVQVAVALAVALTLGGAGRVATALLVRATSVMTSVPLFGGVSPGSPAVIKFVADIPGVHEVELEGSHRTILELQVEP